MARVLVTGATGFVGRVLCAVLHRSGIRVRAALRTDRAMPDCVAEKALVGDIGPATDWNAALNGVDAVMHLAARAHVLNEPAANAEAYLDTNYRGTATLADFAARVGVRRFVYLSSIKVNGEETGERPYTAMDPPSPQDAYGRSKWLGEQSLWDVAEQRGMEAVIVRPPLVYGPEVRANFLRLIRWVDKEWPLPLGAVDNRRSLISVWNLCSLLTFALESTRAAGHTLLASDGEDLSTPDLIRRIARIMERDVRLVPVPVGLLRAGAHLLGRGAEVKRLCGSLVVDSSPARTMLGWSPPVSVDEALRRTVAWYLLQKGEHGH